MRSLVISDVHGNRAALEAVLHSEPFDEILCLGDLVTYGPEPGACVRRLREAGAILVQGNHDRALAENVAPRCRARFVRLADATLPLARRQVAGEDLRWLRDAPHWLFLERASRRLMLVHATPSDPLYGYLGPDPEAWSEQIRATEADVLLVGHTHLQFDLEIDGRRVVNPGSVGQPKDGLPSAAYAVIDAGEISLSRVEYPVEETVTALRESHLAPEDLADLAELLRRGVVPERLER